MARTEVPLPLRLCSAVANLSGPLAYSRIRRMLTALGPAQRQGVGRVYDMLWSEK